MIMVTGFNMPGEIDTVSYSSTISTDSSLFKSDVFCIFFILMEIERNIFAMNIGNISLYTVEICVNRCRINRFGCIVNIGISILGSTVIILIFATHFNGIIGIGSKSRKNNCAVCLSCSLNTVKEIITTVINVICKSKRCGSCFCCWLFKNKNSCYCISACSVMKLTVTLCNIKVNLCIIVRCCACTCNSTGNIIITVFFGEPDMVCTADNITVGNSAFNTGDMYNGTFTQKVENIPLITLEHTDNNIIHIIIKVISNKALSVIISTGTCMAVRAKQLTGFIIYLNSNCTLQRSSSDICTVNRSPHITHS